MLLEVWVSDTAVAVATTNSCSSGKQHRQCALIDFLRLDEKMLLLYLYNTAVTVLLLDEF